MKPTESEQAWDAFCDTGHIGEYLLYAAIRRTEQKKGIDG